MLPVLRFVAGITPPEELHRIGKAEGKGASEQFKERGKTHGPKSTTLTTHCQKCEAAIEEKDNTNINLTCTYILEFMSKL